ncbi:uncharacterized protein BCR38DRAFT_400370 [Pseudomassariella vexata]|uniref:Rhodopsin domain-containing protein n=1 Tax=Pseudomassariella vexata TaxID=1141098 RepID=A0A1Y2DH36_9PEZI|nr:uncharacterized protein BCR38DRAFT_400370 [Pseudomassariella vexata]ORY58573.1 hypothetical protein BCR38DRAFT_400370 [Pseudomassariella vexata]
MGDFDRGFQDELSTSSWSLYGVGVFIIMLRLYSRARRLSGVTHYQIDDYLMMLAGGLFTALIVCLNTIAKGGGSNLYPPELDGTFTAEEVRERIYGSKIVIVSEQAMLNLIYTIKTCMLIMYTRLTLGLNQLQAVHYLAIYVACGWLASEITFFTACRPFEGYWGMPPPDPQCTTLQYYAIVTGCFNISSDLLMLGIPIPLVLRVNIPWRKKVVLLFIFSLGSFVIVVALLTKVFNLNDVWDPSYMLWYTREASVAVYVSNLPMIWPLLREWFPFLRSIGSSNGSYQPNSGAGRKQYRKGSVALESGNPARQIGLVLSPSQNRPSRPTSLDSFNNDIEMGNTSSESAGKDETQLDETQLGVATSTREEQVVGTLGLECETGGIQVERTIVVRKGSGGDKGPGIHDWDQEGTSNHTVNAGSRRCETHHGLVGYATV